MKDKEGRPRAESLVAMVALDNLFDDDTPQAQVLVDYGDAFLENFKKFEFVAHIKSESLSE